MTVQGMVSWEEAVRWYRAQPGNETAIRDNYFDLPVKQAAERYAQSEEFAEVLRLMGSGADRSLLDLGAGNGIASYALAKNGWRVTALEPDESDEVGAGAIRALVRESQLPIEVVTQPGEWLPFADATFAAVNARQVLHHANDLDAMLREVARVLKSGGRVLATREHVADDQAQLEAFRREHPLQHLYGGENAYPLKRYLQAFDQVGLSLRHMWGPLESILNFYPGTERERERALRQVAKHSLLRCGRLFAWSRRFRDAQLRRATRRDRSPGRLFSFMLEKP